MPDQIENASEQPTAGEQWCISIDLPMDAIDDKQRETLFGLVADVVHDWEPEDRDGWDVFVSAGPIENTGERPTQRAETTGWFEPVSYYREVAVRHLRQRDDARQRAASWWEAAKHWCSQYYIAAKAVDKQRDRALAAERRADAAPTEWAYSQACKAVDKHRARADAAEAKLREEQAASANLYGRVFTALGLSVAGPWSGLAAAAAGVRAERDTWESEYERVRDTKLTDLVDAERERDEAREKLDAIQDHAGSFHAFMLSPGNCNPDQVRSRAVSALDGIRRVFEPVTDREEPAPVRGCGHSGPCDCAPDGTDGSLIAEYERNRRVSPPCCRRCWEPERSCRCVEGFWSSATLREPEEPAGETKPRVWNSDDPQPDDVFKIKDNMGDVWERNAIPGETLWWSPDTVPMTWERIAKKYAPLTEVVERQADSEAQ